MDLQPIVDEAFRYAETFRGHGELPEHIPALARVDPRKLAVAVALGDGTTCAAGDADEAFSLQGVSKVFAVSVALDRVKAALWNHVGREPSGSPFNSLVQLEEERGRPRNPMINAGALVVCDQLIGRGTSAEASEAMVKFLSERCCDGRVLVDEEVARSEAQAGSLNRSLAYYLAAFDTISNPVEEILSFYFRNCAVMMSCRQLARAALYLAFDGKDPLAGTTVTTAGRARRLNALMMTCGHYDYSGEFAFRIGLPGKSAASGAVVAIVPGTGAVAVWSPGLNSAGTSLAGAVLLERLVQQTNWSIFGRFGPGEESV